MYAVEGEDVCGGGVPPESDFHLELAGAVVAFGLAVVVGCAGVGASFAAAGVGEECECGGQEEAQVDEAFQWGVVWGHGWIFIL